MRHPRIHDWQGHSLSHCGVMGPQRRGFVCSRMSLDVSRPPPTGQEQVPPQSLEAASGTEALFEGNVPPVIDKRSLCAELGQSERFAEGRIAIYDTDVRRGIREELSSRVLNSGKKPSRVVLTGMGGTGKSHNLAYWVQQQREAGHMVVYVNDMQDWIEGGDKYILKEIEFGMCNWKYWSDDIASVDDVSTLIVKHPWLKTPDGLDLQRRLDSSVAKMKELQSTDSEVYVFTLNPSAWLHALRRVVDAANESGASSRLGGETKPRLLFVVDQENRLQNMWSGSDYPNLIHPDAYHINKVITNNSAHLTVASASANNEGWERRGWTDKLVQSAHGLEPQDADSMIKRLLAPLDLYSEAISARIQVETNNSPLDIKLLCKHCIVKAKTAGDVPNDAVVIWASKLTEAFKKFEMNLSTEAKQASAASLLQNEVNPIIDKRFVEFCDSKQLYVYRNPHIESTIRAWMRQWVETRRIMNEAALYEHSCICALPYLLKGKNCPLEIVTSLGTVVPHLHHLPPPGINGLFVYNCVHNAMYMDHISLDIQSINGIQYCVVGIYQTTINNRNHADSYLGLASDRSLLPNFIRDLQLRNPGINIRICFFWIVKELSSTNELAINGSKLALVRLTKKTHKFADPLNKFNFMYDGGEMYKVSNPNRKRIVSCRGIDEFVFNFDNPNYTPPKFAPAGNTLEVLES